MKALLDAGEEYDFTIEQLIRLKCMQLAGLGVVMTEKERLIIYNDIDRLTEQRGDDSITMRCNAIIFKYLTAKDSDTVLLNARFNKDVPLLIKKQQWDMLGGYYGAMSVFYRRIFKYEKAVEYALLLRPYTPNRLIWYVGIGEDMLEAKHYPQAVLYADSALAMVAEKVVSPENLTGVQRKLVGERFAWALKGKALFAMGERELALALYKKAEKAVEASQINFRKIQKKIEKRVCQAINIQRKTEVFYMIMPVA